MTAEICLCGAPMIAPGRCDVYDCGCSAEPARLELTPELRARYERLARVADRLTFNDYERARFDAACAEMAALEDSLSLEAWCELFEAVDDVQLALWYGYFTMD